MLDVGVIGSINRDTIERPGAATCERLGGVLFTACALAHLGRPKLQVWLLAHVASELAQDLAARLGDVAGLRCDSLLRLEGGGYRCRIRYDDGGGKTETLTGQVPPLTWDSLAPRLPNLEALLVNFITGFELERETLERIRSVFPGPLLMDVHSLTLHRHGDGRRSPRRPPDWPAWVALADVVQMNAAEAGLLGEFDGEDDGQALQTFAVSLLDLGPKVALITRGAAGAVGACRGSDGRVDLLLQAAGPADSDDCDPTGCGDVFLAGFAAAWLQGESPARALACATLAATRNCALHGAEELYRLAEELPL